MANYMITKFITLLILFSPILNHCNVDSYDNFYCQNLASTMSGNSNNITRANCFFYNETENTYFDLYPLEPKSGKNRDYNHSVVDEKYIKSSFFIYYNFCRPNANKCNHQKSLITVKNQFYPTVCHNFTDDPKTLKTWKYINNTLFLTMESNLNNRTITTKFIILCDEKGKDGEIIIDKKYENNLFDFSLSSVNEISNRNISFISNNACKRHDKYPAQVFLNVNVYFFGMLFILVGFYSLFFGIINEGVTTYLFGYFWMYFLFRPILVFVNFHLKFLWVLWFVQIIQFVLGIFISNQTRKNDTRTILFFGSIMGMAVSRIFYMLFFSKVSTHPYVIYLGWFLSCTFINTIISFSFSNKNYTIIFSSSITSSYLIIRGIDFYVGGFPYEGYIIDLLIREEFQVLENVIEKSTYFYYLITAISLSIVGILVQFKQKHLNELVEKGSKSATCNKTIPILNN